METGIRNLGLGYFCEMSREKLNDKKVQKKTRDMSLYKKKHRKKD